MPNSTYESAVSPTQVAVARVLFWRLRPTVEAVVPVIHVKERFSARANCDLSVAAILAAACLENLNVTLADDQQHIAVCPDSLEALCLN